MTSQAGGGESLRESIDAYIGMLSEGHRMHRKIKFLLDIRGLLIINKIAGDYVEFGVYRGEMIYAATRILAPHVRKYIGLDTFAGLPQPAAGDDSIFVFESPGFMASPREQAEAMLEGHPHALIQGDFRREEVMGELAGEVSRISVLCIDCNWPSSVEAAMRASLPYLQPGSVVFIDDYFVGATHPNFNDPILGQASESSGLLFREFMTYPPCARAFLVEPRP